MPQSSRYSDEKVENLHDDLVRVLEKNHTPVDLSLMVLGNMVINLLNTSVAPSQRKMLANSFANALLSSVKEDQYH